MRTIKLIINNVIHQIPRRHIYHQTDEFFEAEYNKHPIAVNRPVTGGPFKLWSKKPNGTNLVVNQESEAQNLLDAIKECLIASELTD